LTRRLLLPFGLGLLIATATAAPLMPSFSPVSSSPSGWYTDRYAPDAFEFVGPYQGRSDVLKISISSADDAAHRPSSQSGIFYNTQGMNHDVTQAGSGSLSAALWVPASWASPSAGLVRTDMWATMFNAANQVSAYPILGFSNQGGPARFRAWSVSDVWQDLQIPVLYDQWNNLTIEYTGTNFNHYVNGRLVFSETDVNGTAKFANTIMQAYNFGQGFGPNNGPDYSVYWSTGIPEPSTILLAGAGLVALALLRRR